MASPNLDFDPEVRQETAREGSGFLMAGGALVIDILAVGQLKLALSYPDSSIIESAQHLSTGIGLTAISATLLTGAIQISKQK